MRVIASVYTGSTEKRAIDDLVKLGAQVRISYDTTQTRLHAKSWLFERASQFDTAYVGSSNLTQSALVDGLEWNVRLTSTDNPDIVEQIRRTFDQYWNDPEFELYDPQVDGDRLADALASQAQPADILPTPAPSVGRPTPKPFQVPMLDSLQAERQRGHFKNLVVAPTGTGKTWVSAFDYESLRRAGYERLLFVAHRDEILRQSQDVFRLVVGDPAFGERHVGSERPVAWTHVFASIQSLHRVVESLRADQFDVVIVDEFHHAEADTYRKLLGRLAPKVLLGLTATPERADGNDILHWFDNRIAYEMRLWEALDRGFLSPFHYLGSAMARTFAGSGLSAGVMSRATSKGSSPATTFALSEFSKRSKNGYSTHLRCEHSASARASSMPVHGRTVRDGWISSRRAGRKRRSSNAARSRRAGSDAGRLRAIFTVDIFNEGVDIPEVDTLLFSARQKAQRSSFSNSGAGSVVSRVRKERSDRARLHRSGACGLPVRHSLSGDDRWDASQSRTAPWKWLSADAPGCAIRLDKIAQEIVLANLRTAIGIATRAHRGPAWIASRDLIGVVS